MTIRPIANPVRLAQDEIRKALEQAATAIDTHEQGGDGTPPWNTCREHLQQVRGALVMLDVQGGVALCDECLGLAEALEQDRSLSREQGLDVLMYGLLLLPRYLHRVAEQRRELPATLLPTLNALRCMRRTTPLPDYHFASFERVDMDLSCLSQPQEPDPRLETTARRLRLMLQVGLLGLFRSPDSALHARQVQQALERMGNAFGDTLTGRWMRLGAHCLEAVASGQLQADDSLRLLLSRIDLHLRTVALGGTAGLDALPPPMVTNGLLYYTALGGEHNATLGQLRAQLGLKTVLAPPALVEHEREALAAPDRGVMEAVSKAAREELDRLKDDIESLANTGELNAQDRDALGGQIGALGNTLAIIGLSEAAALLKREQTRLHSLEDEAGANRILDALQHLAESLTLAEDQLQDLTQPAGACTRRPKRLVEAEGRVVDECLKNLARVRRALEFLNGDVDEGESIRLMDQPLQETAGILRMLNQPEAARILEQCRLEIASLPQEGTPEEGRLSALADALAGLEWFLESLRASDNGEESLELAGEALRSLATP
ncbi:MAG: hypothetical protein JJT90_18755 [Ectothiorhodospiraceae bacterium]|nr:hypothetical protein [Ectothiorhodospiraceae bacterium]